MRFIRLGCAEVLMLGALLYGQQTQGLDRELRRIGVGTAIVMPAQEVQEYPLWSPQGDYLAVNVMGAWQKVDLSQISIKVSTWHGNQKVGVINSKSISTPTRDELAAGKKVSKVNPRRVTTKSGLKIELKLDEFGASTSMWVTRKGEKPQLLWTASMESYHSLVLSPDETYVAFVSDVQGVIVMRLSDLE